MKFRVISKTSNGHAQSPVRVVEQTTGREVGWINRYLDREYVRRLADKTLRIYAHNLLHFVRWWASIHHTGEVTEGDLTESTLLEYLRFQSSLQPRPSGVHHQCTASPSPIALSVTSFPMLPARSPAAFISAYLRRGPMGLGRPRLAMSRLRVKDPKRNIVPLSVDEVARFWSSFRTSRDLAIVGLMLLQGLRSAEVLALNRDDVLLSEGANSRPRQRQQTALPSAGAGNHSTARSLFATGTTQSLRRRVVRFTQGTRTRRAHDPCGFAFLIPLSSPDHRHQLANPHRFRHTFASDMVRAGVSLPALMQLMGHADIQTTLLYVQITPQDVYLQYARAVSQHIRRPPVIRHEPRPASSASTSLGFGFDRAVDSLCCCPQSGHHSPLPRDCSQVPPVSRPRSSQADSLTIAP